MQNERRGDDIQTYVFPPGYICLRKINNMSVEKQKKPGIIKSNEKRKLCVFTGGHERKIYPGLYF